MQERDSARPARTRLAIAYTSKPVSGWGGLVPVLEYVERLGLRAVFAQALPDGRRSPNQIPVVDIVLVFLASVLTGGRRFAHVERLRADAVVQAILGVQRMPSAMTVTRYFNGFVRSQVEHLATVLWRVTLARLVVPQLGAVLDLDSTVFERYGAQEGSRGGHNPRKPGRPLHHPLLALLAEAKVVLHVWLRSGHTTSASGVRAFLTEALAQLPASVRLYALRADSGFFVAEVLTELEARGLPYAIAVRLTPHVKRAVAGLRTWTPFGPGLEVSATPYQAPTWAQPRRVVVIRERVGERPEARGRRLLEVPGYTFHTLVTTLDLAPADVWRFYKARGESENRLKELKEDFGANGFCLQSFEGTDAALRLICFLFNLLASFKREVTGDEAPRLLTLRSQLLVTGGVLGARGHTRVLRLGLRGRWRARFAQILARVAALPPTVAQAAKRVIAEGIPPPRPWRPRGALRIVPVQLRLRPALN